MAGRRRGRYSPEYRERMVELVRAGRSPGSLAREFEPSEQTIRNWVRQADLDEGSPERRTDDRGARGDAAPEGGRQAAADGAGHPKISRGLVREEERKVPPGQKLGELVSSEETPLATTVSVAWAESPDKGILWESEPSLRQKIARAEARVAMLRAISVGAAAGTAVAILQEALPVIVDWTSHWSGIIMGVAVGVIHANPEA